MRKKVSMPTSTPPEFIADYPTGKLESMGRNLRETALNGSRYVPPIRESINNDVSAIVLPLVCSVARTRKLLLHNMKLAERYDLWFVALCSGSARRSDVAQLARRFTSLKWAAVDGPFPPIVDGLENAGQPILSIAGSWDLAAKRNFGLRLARKLGWSSILMCDDDVSISDEHFLKEVELLRGGATLVASNMRDRADHSVVVGAFREIYGEDQVDSYLNCSAVIVRPISDVFSYYPNIYNEDWFFLVPYLLKFGAVTWAGSVPQRAYTLFLRRRAAFEESGDLLAEGVMRLVMDIMQKHPSEPYTSLLDELARRADESYWEHQILHRAVVISDLLRRVRPVFARFKAVRIEAALKSSMRMLIGDDFHEGVDPSIMAKWVKRWIDDLRILDSLSTEQRLAQAPSMREALLSLAVLERTSWEEPARPSAEEAVDSPPLTTSEQVLAALPQMPRSGSRRLGLESTFILSRYMDKHNLEITMIVKAVGRVRYDRPIRSLDWNKPTATIVMVIRALEEPNAIISSVRQIIRWNYRCVPIHLVLWIVPSRDRRVESYRDYIVATVALETAGTNIRILSAVAKSSVDAHLNDEIIQILALSYWKTNIESVDHSLVLVNSQNEVLDQGTLSHLLQGQSDEISKKLSEWLSSIRSPFGSNGLEARDDIQAAEAVRERLITRSRMTDNLRPLPLRHEAPTLRLMRSMNRADISWLKLDDLHYFFRVHHNDRDVTVIRDARLVFILRVPYTTELRRVRLLVDTSLQRLSRMRYRAGAVAELTVVVTGSTDTTVLEEYREEIARSIQLYNIVSKGVFISSCIVPGQSDPVLSSWKPVEALIRYCHWLENHKSNQKLIWVVPGLWGRPILVRRRWFLAIEDLLRYLLR